MRELRSTSTRCVSARRFHAFSAFQPRFLTFFLPPPPFVLLLMDRRLELLPPRPPPLLPIHLPQHSPLRHAEKHVCSHKTFFYALNRTVENERKTQSDPLCSVHEQRPNVPPNCPRGKSSPTCGTNPHPVPRPHSLRGKTVEIEENSTRRKT